jgi:hypothetical protein
MGQAIGAAVDAHIREHIAFDYRSQIETELGVELPPLGQPLPEDLEQRLSTLTARAAEQLLGKKQAMQQAEENAAMQEDPIIQQGERELDIREGELQRKAQADQLDADIKESELQRRAQADQLDADIKKMAIQSKENIAGAQIEQDERESQREAQTEDEHHSSSKTLDAIKLGAEIAAKANPGTKS